jgi:hypothetical protein
MIGVSSLPTDITITIGVSSLSTDITITIGVSSLSSAFEPECHTCIITNNHENLPNQ